MKFKSIIFICLFMLAFADIYAQTSLFRSGSTADAAVSGDKAKQNVINNLKGKSKTGEVKVFDFNKKALTDKSISIEIVSGQVVVFVNDEIEERGPEDLSWYGHSDVESGGTMVLSYLNGEIAGSIVIGSKKYIVSPLGEGKCTVYESDDSVYPKDHPGNEGGLIPAVKSQDAEEFDAYGVCRVRVLVAYTTLAQTGATAKGFSDMKLFVQQAISEANQSYINSSVGHRMHLAACIRASYNESGNYDTDLERFKAPGDGFMDHVHTYRSLYSADLCALIFDNSAYCGLAYTINAVASTAFCVVHYDCATGYYSFAHELGHLYGCRHNPEEDGTTTPYAYGHGFNNIPKGWRTIMAYNVDATPTTRIQYWSNPSVTYGGVAMGDAAQRNNARVLNARDVTVAAFVAQPANLTLTSSGRVISGETGDAVATTSIRLSSGFRASTGSIFKASVGACSGGFRYADTEFTADQQTSSGLNEVNIYPNPSLGAYYMDLNYSSARNITVSVFNFTGEKVYSKNLGSLSSTQCSFDLTNQPAGIYMVSVQADDEVQNHQVVVVK